jgi:4-amino-4-deoxy-L-arabinose transferase-like glycosyltransferase
MNRMDDIKTKFLSRNFLWCDNAILFYLAFAKLLIHLLTGNGYGYFGDELYWIDITKHLDFGYVDVPPMVAYLGALSRFLVGTSLFAVHLLPAIAGAVMVYFAGLMARELGGGRFAQCLTALMVIAAPIWLSFNSWFAYDPFDQLFTIIFLYLVILLLKQETPRRWVFLGIITGVGLMTKLSMLFMGFSLVLALMVTSHRKWLFSKWPLIAAAIGLVIFTPFLVWQSIHAWPLLTYLRYYPSVHPFPGFLQSFWEQITYLNPVTVPVWILGLYYLLFHREGKKYRVLGLMYLVLQLLLVGVLKLESRVSASAYFSLLAAGAVFTEKFITSLTTRRPGWHLLKPVFVGIILLCGLILAPLALPVLPIPVLEKYGYVESDWSLPIYFSLRFGWPEMVQKIAVIYHQLPEAERRKCVIYTCTNFEAGAINLFGNTYGLPGAISNHLSYQIWGLGKYNAEVAIAFGHRFNPGILPLFYNEVTKTNIILGNQYGIAPERNLSVYICRKPTMSLKKAWRRLENYSF